MVHTNRSLAGWLLAAAVGALVAGCATSGAQMAGGAGAGAGAAETVRLCDAAPAQRHVGQQATAAIGAAILAASGARTLRWGPPRSAWTMDYRQDRVNVRYDDAMTIIDITCE